MRDATAAIATVPDERAAIATVVHYADALDGRDWRAYRALFEDRVTIDYGAIGSLVGTIAADEWTSRCRALEGFDATAHRVHQPVVAIVQDVATVRSIVDAAHFVSVGGQVLMGDLTGRYVHRLHRHRDGWRIGAVTLDLVGYPAGKPAFDAAFAAARGIFAGRSE